MYNPAHQPTLPVWIVRSCLFLAMFIPAQPDELNPGNRRCWNGITMPKTIIRLPNVSKRTCQELYTLANHCTWSIVCSTARSILPHKWVQAPSNICLSHRRLRSSFHPCLSLLTRDAHIRSKQHWSRCHSFDNEDLHFSLGSGHYCCQCRQCSKHYRYPKLRGRSSKCIVQDEY